MANDNSTRNGGEFVLGALVSVTSSRGIRYEGTLYFLNAQESTLGLQNARNYGTEGRSLGMQVPPSDTVYEHLQFHFRDLVELHVKSIPPAQPEEQNSNSSTNNQAEKKKLGPTPCNSHDHRDRNEHNRFNKRMRLNTEVSFS